MSLTAIGCAATGPQFEPVILSENQAVVYVYRPGQDYVGSAVAPNIMVDGERVGRLKNNGYSYKIVTPGEHEVSCTTEVTSKVPFEAAPLTSYYIEAEIQMGFFMGRPKLIMVPADVGSLAIKGTKCCNRSPSGSINTPQGS